MKPKTMILLKNASDLMALEGLNPAELPMDQAIQVIMAIAALAQAEALIEIASELKQLGTTFAGMSNDAPMQVQQYKG